MPETLESKESISSGSALASIEHLMIRSTLPGIDVKEQLGLLGSKADKPSNDWDTLLTVIAAKGNEFSADFF